MEESVTLNNSSLDLDISSSSSLSSSPTNFDNALDLCSSLLFCKDPLEELNFNKNIKVAENLLVDHCISNSKPSCIYQDEPKQDIPLKSPQDKKDRYYSLFESDSISNNLMSFQKKENTSNKIFESLNIFEKNNQSILSSSEPKKINNDLFMNSNKFSLSVSPNSSKFSINKSSLIEKPSFLAQESDLNTTSFSKMKNVLSCPPPIIGNYSKSSLQKEPITNKLNDINVSMDSLNINRETKLLSSSQPVKYNYTNSTENIFRNNSVSPKFTTAPDLPFFKNNSTMNPKRSASVPELLSYHNHSYFNKSSSFDSGMVPSTHEKLNIHYPISVFKEMKKNNNENENFKSNDNDSINKDVFMNNKISLTENNTIINAINKYDEMKINQQFSSQILSFNSNEKEKEIKCSSPNQLKLVDLNVEDDEEEYYIYKSSTGGFYRCKSKYKNYHSSINNNNNNNELNQTSYFNFQYTQTNDNHKSPSQKFAEIVNLSRKSITQGNFTQIFKKDILVCSICSSCPKQFGLLSMIYIIYYNNINNILINILINKFNFIIIIYFLAECDHVFCLDCIKVKFINITNIH